MAWCTQVMKPTQLSASTGQTKTFHMLKWPRVDSRTREENSRKRSESVSWVFPEFLPESPSRTGGVAHSRIKEFLAIIGVAGNKPFIWMSTHFGGTDSHDPRSVLLKTLCKIGFSNVQGGPGSVRFGYGLGMERFERFRFSVPAVPLRRGFFRVSAQFHGEDGSGSGFGSWKRFRRFRFRVGFLGKRFRRFRFPVPVRFLGHPER